MKKKYNALVNYFPYSEKLFEIFFKLRDGGFFHLLSASYLLKIFGFASQIFIGWILIKEDIGRIGVLQNFLGIFLVISGFGFDASILKFCSENISDNLRYSLFKKGNLYSYYSIIGALILGVVLSQFNVFSPDAVINQLIFAYFLNLIPLTYTSNFMAYLQAVQKIKLFAKIQIISKSISIILLIALSYFFGLKGYIGAILLSNFITMMFLKSIEKKVKTEVIEGEYLKKHMNYAIPSVITNFFSIVSNGADILLLNYLVSARDEIGVYAFALIAMRFLMVISQATRQYLTPKFSYHSDKSQEIFKLLKKYIKKWLPFGVGISLLAMIVMTPFLFFFKDGSYKEAIMPFIILAVAWIFASINSLQTSLFFGAGYVNHNMLYAFIRLVFTLAGVYIGFTLFGIIGAPLGILFARVCQMYLMQLHIKHLQKQKLLNA